MPMELNDITAQVEIDGRRFHLYAQTEVPEDEPWFVLPAITADAKPLFDNWYPVTMLYYERGANGEPKAPTINPKWQVNRSDDPEVTCYNLETEEIEVFDTTKSAPNNIGESDQKTGGIMV